MAMELTTRTHTTASHRISFTFIRWSLLWLFPEHEEESRSAFSHDTSYKIMPFSCRTITPRKRLILLHLLLKCLTEQTTAVPLHERSDIECQADSISIFLPKTLLPGGRNVTWRDESCFVSFNGSHYLDSIFLSECGTTIQIDNDKVTFSNDLIVHKPEQTSAERSSITFGEDYETVVPVKCIYGRHKNVSTSYMPIKQHARFLERRYGELDVAMEQYDSGKFSRRILATDYPRKVPLDEDIFIRVGLTVDSKELRLRVDHCIATSTPSPADGNWRQLIQSGCPIDPVHLLSASNATDVRFRFKAFDFRQNSSGFVYIHCEVSVCVPDQQQCIMGCPARAKRAAIDSHHGGSHLVSTGPFMVDRDQNYRGPITMTAGFAGVCLLVAMVAAVLAIIGWTRKPKHSEHVTAEL